MTYSIFFNALYFHTVHATGSTHLDKIILGTHITDKHKFGMLCVGEGEKINNKVVVFWGTPEKLDEVMVKIETMLLIVCREYRMFID